MTRSINYHCSNRLFEWVMTGALLGLGLLILVYPKSMGASAFRYILDIIGPLWLATFYLLIGGFRIAALIANGSWPTWGPMIRASACGAAALIWAQMDIALLMLIPQAGTPPSPGIPVYFALTIGEIFSCYRVLANNAERT